MPRLPEDGERASDAPAWPSDRSLRVMHPSVVSAPVRSPRHPRGSSARVAAIRRMLAAGFVLAAVALLLLAGATTPARAADDVANDAVLTVVVLDGTGGSGLAGAEVLVTARREGASIGARGGVTANDGSVTVDGLPRALAGSAVTLDVAARLARTWRDDDGCSHEDARTGAVTGLVAGADVSVEVIAEPTSSVVCDVVWPGPTASPVAPAAPAAGASHRPPLTPPPTDVQLRSGPAHKLLPGWGWVVLGMICFAVVLGLAWPDHRDRG
jgi:hypothetical protein